MKCSERQFFVWVNERDRSSFWTSRISVRWASIELCYVNFSLNLFVNFVFVFQKFLEVFGDLDTVCSLIQDCCPESNSIRRFGDFKLVRIRRILDMYAPHLFHLLCQTEQFVHELFQRDQRIHKFSFSLYWTELDGREQEIELLIL